MTTRTKVLVGAAAAVGLFLFLRSRKSPSGSAFFTELNLVNCKCHRTEFFRDGTTKSVRVRIGECISDEALSDAAAKCIDTGDADMFGPFGIEDFAGSLDNAVSSLFASPDTNARNPGQAV